MPYAMLSRLSFVGRRIQHSSNDQTVILAPLKLSLDLCFPKGILTKISYSFESLTIKTQQGEFIVDDDNIWNISNDGNQTLNQSDNIDDSTCIVRTA